jgi:hypothetical protein
MKLLLILGAVKKSNALVPSCILENNNSIAGGACYWKRLTQSYFIRAEGK